MSLSDIDVVRDAAARAYAPGPDSGAIARTISNA